MVCDAGGPYSVECTGGSATVMLDAGGSFDPEGGDLTYSWMTDCPTAMFTGGDTATPMLTFDTSGGCAPCTVTVQVTEEDGGTASCNATVTTSDTTNPVINGDPADLDECYPSLTVARNAACERVLPFAEDNCDPMPACDTNFTAMECETTIDAFLIDSCTNRSDPVSFPTFVDEFAPTADCNATDTPYLVDENCEATIYFTGMVMDTCCVDIDSVMVTAMLQSGMGTVGPAVCEIEYDLKGKDDDAKVNVSCSVQVSNVTQCPVLVKIELTGDDCCGNPLAMACMDTATVEDMTPPTIGTPDPIPFCFADLFSAGGAAANAVNAVASDNCGGIPTTNVMFSAEECATTMSVTLTDRCDNDSRTVDIPAFIDGEAPMVMCPPDLEVECGLPYDPGMGTATDNCVLNPPVTVDITEIPGNCREESGQVAGGVSPPPKLTILRNFGSSDGGSTVAGGVTVAGEDPLGCDNVGMCTQTIEIFDTLPPMITHCPPPIELERGDKICNNEVTEWLNSFTAEDICGDVVLSNDAPDCGFPPGTTVVTFTATDECGLTASCTSMITSTVTVDPLKRVTTSEKGSLLIFSKIEVKWAEDGTLLQDTFLDFTNDYPNFVTVQGYFINGDVELEQLCDNPPCTPGNETQHFEPGWNTADCRFTLTANQPHYWSAARGSNKCQPFVVLDEDGPGRPDPEDAGSTRVLRGYAIFYAVRFNPALGEDGAWEEIRWNHLKGDAVIVNYANGTAWEYNAWSASAHCGPHGLPLLDCTEFDEDGVCCSAEVIPGRLDLDGFQYDVAFDTLLLDFYAAGSTILSGGGVTASVNTDLTLHVVDADLRQDGCGPVLTKVEAEIWNEFESKFSGTRRCICCWDQTLLSDWSRSEIIPNHFGRSALRTDKGKARLDGVGSFECDYEELCGRNAFQKMWNCGMDFKGGPGASMSHDAAILGLATKFIAFTGGGASPRQATAGMNLVGAGEERASILVDIDDETPELSGVDPEGHELVRPAGALEKAPPRRTRN